MNNLTLALQITAVGMGLVFAVIILLWWLMALLTSVTADKKSPPAELASAPHEEDERARVAAIAVAIAMAEPQLPQTHPLSLPHTAIISAWQLGMRTRQLSGKGTPIVRNPRKIG